MQTFGPVLGESVCQLYDTLIYQPNLQFEGSKLVITSLTPAPTSTALITPDTVSVGDEASTSTASYDDVCVTIKLHKVNLLE